VGPAGPSRAVRQLLCTPALSCTRLNLPVDSKNCFRAAGQHTRLTRVAWPSGPEGLQVGHGKRKRKRDNRILSLRSDRTGAAEKAQNSHRLQLFALSSL
jgi:hypothetical protein